MFRILPLQVGHGWNIIPLCEGVNMRDQSQLLRDIPHHEVKREMPKSKPSNVVQIDQRNLVDAEAMGALIGFTAQYVNRMAAAGRISWHGVRNGAKVYRRYDPLQVLDELRHGARTFESSPNK